MQSIKWCSDCIFGHYSTLWLWHSWKMFWLDTLVLCFFILLSNIDHLNFHNLQSIKVEQNLNSNHRNSWNTAGQYGVTGRMLDGCPWPLPSRHTLTLSTPLLRQSPAGTQKPALAGFSSGAARTSAGGAKRNAGIPFTSVSVTYPRWIDLNTGHTEDAWMTFVHKGALAFKYL